MTNPVLFLDVDGVLNTHATKSGADGVRDFESRQSRVTNVVEIAKVAAVARLVEACNARIVVSSSWRSAFATSADFAAAIGIAPPLADAPDLFHRDWRTEQKLSSARCHEIKWWLDNHEFVRRYAVIDDHMVFPPDWVHAKHEVRTDASVGITNGDFNRAASLLIGSGELKGRDWFA